VNLYNPEDTHICAVKPLRVRAKRGAQIEAHGVKPLRMGVKVGEVRIKGLMPLDLIVWEKSERGENAIYLVLNTLLETPPVFEYRDFEVFERLPAGGLLEHYVVRGLGGKILDYAFHSRPDAKTGIDAYIEWCCSEVGEIQDLERAFAERRVHHASIKALDVNFGV
jgi:hypothetical protein